MFDDSLSTKIIAKIMGVAAFIGYLACVIAWPVFAGAIIEKLWPDSWIGSLQLGSLLKAWFGEAEAFLDRHEILIGSILFLIVITLIVRFVYIDVRDSIRQRRLRRGNPSPSASEPL